MSGQLDAFGTEVIPPAAPPRRGERAERDRLLEIMEAKRREYVRRLRAQMETLYLLRSVEVASDGAFTYEGNGQRESVAWVCADDARRVFESWHPPKALSRNFLGQLFRDGQWEALPDRRVLSSTPGSHANELKCWRLKGDTEK